MQADKPRGRNFGNCDPEQKNKNASAQQARTATDLTVAIFEIATSLEGWMQADRPRGCNFGNCDLVQKNKNA